MYYFNSDCSKKPLSLNKNIQTCRWKASNMTQNPEPWQMQKNLAHKRPV